MSGVNFNDTTTKASTSSSGSPLSTKGDIYTYSTADARLPVGTNGYVLSADSAETTGLKWIASAGGGLSDNFIYGDYSDGDVTISTSVALTRDMYYEDLVISSGGILNPTNCIIYAKSVTIDSGGIIQTTQQNGNNGSGATGGAANSSISGESLPSYGSSAAGWTEGDPLTEIEHVSQKLYEYISNTVISHNARLGSIAGSQQAIEQTQAAYTGITHEITIE